LGLKAFPCLMVLEDGLEGNLEFEMPRFFFDVKNGHRLIDPAGLDCRDVEQAMAQGVVIADQIAEDSPASSSRHISVLDDERREVGTVSINVRGNENHHIIGEQAGRDHARKGALEQHSQVKTKLSGAGLDEAE
jgi:hypothetical protein